MQFNLVNFYEHFDENGLIENPLMVTKDKNNKESAILAPGGIFCEEIFGKSMGDSVEYSCAPSCKETRGKFALGTICPSCNTPVTKKQSMVRKQGWIDLGNHGIINPLLFKFAEKIIGKNNFAKVINPDHALDINGNVIPVEDDKTTKKLRDLGILNMGIHNFLESYVDILEHFTTDDNRDIFEFIQNNQEKFILRYIPVISQRLRPAMIIGNEFKFDKINNLYIRIINCANTIKDLEYNTNTELIINPILSAIQSFANQLHDKLIESIGGKNGWLRNNLMSNRVNFSSRTVITPLPVNCKLDEAHIPYLAAVELLKFHLIRMLLPLYNYSYYRALAVWKNATLNFNQEIYDLLNLILSKQKDGLRILINRNPTIAFGSILNMRVGKIKNNYSDLTMSIPNNILSLISGDFDGDVLSIFLITDNDFKKHFSKLKPTNMLISNNHGRFSDNLLLDKDYQLGFYSLMS